MSKLRVQKCYGVAPSALLNRPDLSLKAKGLFVFLQSKPENWSFSVERIAKQTKDGKDSVRGAIKELETAGYLRRTPVKNKDGRFDGYDYILAETPPSENSPTVAAMTVNTDTLNKKENSKQDIVKKTVVTTAAQSAAGHPSIVKIIDAFGFNPSHRRWYANKTQRQAAGDLAAAYGEEQVLKVIELLPRTNKIPYFPVISTPLQLLTKWDALVAAYIREKHKANKKISNQSIVL